jgi:hypothetical protein
MNRLAPAESAMFSLDDVLKLVMILIHHHRLLLLLLLLLLLVTKLVLPIISSI